MNPGIPEQENQGSEITVIKDNETIIHIEDSYAAPDDIFNSLISLSKEEVISVHMEMKAGVTLDEVSEMTNFSPETVKSILIKIK